MYLSSLEIISLYNKKFFVNLVNAFIDKANIDIKKKS